MIRIWMVQQQNFLKLFKLLLAADLAADLATDSHKSAILSMKVKYLEL